jgi:ubiquinone/menaquinone biosynthesis C-methylase UbiE
MDIVQADAEDLPFRNDCTDLAYSFGVLHHTPNTEKAVREIHRIVRNAAFVMLYNVNLSYYALRLRHPTLPRQTLFNMYDGTNLSKLYSKSEVKNLFRSFSSITVKSRMFWAGRSSKFVYCLLLFMHYSGLERVYGSFNLIFAEKKRPGD